MNITQGAARIARGLHRGVPATKPYADILAPIALILFAYKANEVSREQVDIQQAQSEIQEAQAKPYVKVVFTDPAAGQDHKAANCLLAVWSGQ